MGEKLEHNNNNKETELKYTPFDSFYLNSKS